MLGKENYSSPYVQNSGPLICMILRAGAFPIRLLPQIAGRSTEEKSIWGSGVEIWQTDLRAGAALASLIDKNATYLAMLILGSTLQ
jgi:hypothetical protein